MLAESCWRFTRHPQSLACVRNSPLSQSLSFSLLVDVNHAERSRLVRLSFIFNGEDHYFIAREAVRLLFGDFEDEGNQLLHVLLCKQVHRKSKSEVSRSSNAEPVFADDRLWNEEETSKEWYLQR